jgi:hypothetical protein
MTAILSEIERQKKIAQAQTWDANEKALAARLAEQLAAKFASREKVPITEAQPTLTDDEQALWRDFTAWSAAEGIRHLPSRPSSVASYLLERKLTHEQMLDVIAAIGKAHDRHGLSNPTATAIVRSVLELETEDKPPRPWKAEIKYIWARLPAEIRYEVGRIERTRDAGFSREWKRQIEINKKLEAQLNAEKQNEIIKSSQDISEPRTAAAE